MLKKNDTLPFILALISTLVVLGLGYGVWAKIAPSTTAKENVNRANNRQPITSSSSSSKATSALSFSDPTIVPMGISVKINGSKQMKTLNKLLKRSFQREFPGTTVDFNSDGSETGVKLLMSGQVDLAAISRPLKEEEMAQGLIAVNVSSESSEGSKSSDSGEMFYAYREPANMKVEAFLGHLFSIQGQEAIVDRSN